MNDDMDRLTAAIEQFLAAETYLSLDGARLQVAGDSTSGFSIQIASDQGIDTSAAAALGLTPGSGDMADWWTTETDAMDPGALAELLMSIRTSVYVPAAAQLTVEVG